MRNFKKEFLIVPAVFCAAAFIYYGRFLDNFFIFDDFGYIENILHGPSSVLLGYHTLRVVSNVVWWPLYSMSGFHPVIFNLFSIILHSFNAVLVSLLLLKLIGRKDYAVLGGAIFLLSSAGCDAIFWKSTNSTLISLYFCLLTLHSYVLYRQKGLKVYSAVSIIAFLLAMFSKEEAASIPFIIILVELVFFNGIKDKKAAIRKAAPYAAIVLLYILAVRLVFGYMLHSSDDPSTLFKLRPFHTLLSGWTVFFLSPDGLLEISDPVIYLTALGIALSFFWVKDRKLLYFGYGWIFLSFLPQSLTNLGQLEPRVISNSISRYLYSPSVGASVVWVAIIFRFRERFGPKVFYAAASVFLVLFIGLNYGRVQQRGTQWRETARPEAEFLDFVGHAMPRFPPNSHIFVLDAPLGWTYSLQAIRSYYNNLDIHWITNPVYYTRKPGENAFLIINRKDPRTDNIFPILHKIPQEIFQN